MVLLRKVVPLFGPHKNLAWAGFLLLIPVTAASLAPGLILAHLFDYIFVTGDFNLILIWAAVLIGVIGAGTWLGYLQAVYLYKLGLLIITDLKDRLFEHTLHLGLEFHETNSPGKLLSRVESDTETLGALFGEIAARLLKNIVMTIAILVILSLRNFAIASWLLILMPLLFAGVFLFLTFIRKFWMEMRARTAILIGYVAEYMQGVEVIQQFNYQAVARRRMHEVNMSRFMVRVPAAIYGSIFWAGFLFGEIVAIIIIIFVGYKGIVAGTVTIGTMALFIEFIRRMYMPILELSHQFMFVQRSLVSIERVFGILETERTEVDGTAEPIELTFNREIAFENVWFAYKNEEWVLEDVSFTVKKGEKVALVGSSGGGKTTIVSLLLRFYDPQKGRITIDGRDIRDFPVETWRRQLGLVLQDIVLFPGTVTDNLRLFDKSVSREHIEKVSKIAHADEIIRNLPGGYDEMLSERGSNLSVGERQLLSFARALAYDPAVLVLDEATSSVDPHTERLVQEALEKLIEGRTSVIVAHRLSTILNADTIHLVENGRIAESGPHDELMALGGIYSRLYNLQFLENTGSESGGGSL